MSYHSDRPAHQIKLEAKRFQEELRRALAPARKVTNPQPAAQRQRVKRFLKSDLMVGPARCASTFE